MSRFRDDCLSQKRFVHLPTIGGVPGFSQARGSLNTSSASSQVSSISTKQAAQLQEGDLITGTINIANKQVCMVPTVQGSEHTEEKTKAVCLFIFC